MKKLTKFHTRKKLSLFEAAESKVSSSDVVITLVFPLMYRPMENIGGGMAALAKSAVGPIWLGRQLE